VNRREEHNKTKTKLFAAVITLLISLVMLVTASLAWLTISTKPEISGMQVQLFTGKALLISDAEDGEYSQLLSLGGYFSGFVELRPVSTIDGVNWFLPDYESSGELKDPSEFILDDSLAHANVLKCNSDGTPLDNLSLRKARETGSYVYADIWLKTQEDYCDVRLSVPAVGSTELDGWEIEQGTYGTWALASYELDGDTAIMDLRAQAALRVGFLTEQGTDNQRFVIFEPNADMRSALNKPEYSSDGITHYVPGYLKDDNNYIEGYYIPTQPIGINGNSDGVLTDIDSNNLIIQFKSEWDGAKLQQALSEGKRPCSNEVSHMGRFVKDNAALLTALDENMHMAAMDENGGNTSVAAEALIVRLKKDIPQKVRMFIWIEGQDVDCWNDIATGSFVINLELAGETK
jgi:hypothetical protein